MIIILTYILVFLIICELFLAFIYFPSVHGLPFYALKKKFAVYQYDPLTGYAFRPNLNYSKAPQIYPNAPRKKEYVNVHTDKHGFVFTDNIEQIIKEKKKLLFCIGGSTTAGLESQHDKTYPAQLDRLLKPLNYRCVNAGLGGGRSIHELLLLKHKVLPFKPSAVIIFSGYNDFEAYAYNVYRPKNPYMHYLSHVLDKNPFERLLGYSCIYFLIKQRIHRFKIRRTTKKNFQTAIDNPAWLSEWSENINSMIDLCKDNNIKCFLISTVSPVYKDAPPEAKEFADKDLDMSNRFDHFVAFLDLIHHEAQNICQKRDVEFLDVRPFFEKYFEQMNQNIYYKDRFSLFSDRAHFTEMGNQLLAQSIFEQIKEKLS